MTASDPAAGRNRPGTEKYWASPRPGGGSYCNSATCLAHRRGVYVNLQEWAWVHTDGWPCDAMAVLTEIMQVGHADELAVRFGRRAAPRRRPAPQLLPKPQLQPDAPGCEDGALFTIEELAALGGLGNGIQTGPR